jgi:hypothetical protein
VTEVAFLGSIVRYRVQVTDEIELTAEVHDPEFAALRAVGEPVTLRCGASRVTLLPDQG